MAVARPGGQAAASSLSPGPPLSMPGRRVADLAALDVCAAAPGPWLPLGPAARCIALACRLWPRARGRPFGSGALALAACWPIGGARLAHRTATQLLPHTGITAKREAALRRALAGAFVPAGASVRSVES